MIKESRLQILFIMLISPSLGLWLALKSRFYQNRRFFLTAFITIFGSVFIYTESNDLYRHIENVTVHYGDMAFSTFIEEIYLILIFDPHPETRGDLYIHFLSYFLGSVVNLPGLFVTIVAFVYGYFFSGAVIKITSYSRVKKAPRLFIVFSIAFLLFMNIDGFSTVRTWTGLWVLVYGCLSYYETKKTKYLILIFAVPLFHVGYFIMCIPAWIVLLVKSRPLLYSFLFFISFIGPLVRPAAVLDNLATTELGAEKTRIYYRDTETESVGKPSKEYVQTIESRTWYKNLQKSGFQTYPVIIISCWLILSGYYLRRMDKLEKFIFSVGILTLALSNSTTFLYALHNRTELIGSVFILASVVLFIRRHFLHNQNLIRFNFIDRAVLYGTPLLFIPFFIYTLSALLYNFGFFMIIMPALVWIDSSINLSIREFLGFFI